ncbi:MAG: VUT family protein, partial [Pseudomonadota bacterium]
MFYFLVIPFLNWSFGVIDPISLAQPSSWFAKGIELHPLTLVTGLVFVLRDFVQRNVGQKVLIMMALAIGWSFYYAWPVIALASGIAFAVSELVDWALYTFTKYKLSTRILLSSALAAPVDTTIFLYGADLARQIRLDDEPGNMLHFANWVVFVIGKMVGAVVVSEMIRRRENAGLIDPQSV